MNHVQNHDKYLNYAGAFIESMSMWYNPIIMSILLDKIRYCREMEYETTKEKTKIGHRLSFFGNVERENLFFFFSSSLGDAICYVVH